MQEMPSISQKITTRIRYSLSSISYSLCFASFRLPIFYNGWLVFAIQSFTDAPAKIAKEDSSQQPTDAHCDTQQDEDGQGTMKDRDQRVGINATDYGYE